MIVVATNDVEVDDVVVALHPHDLRVLAPGGPRRLVLTSMEDEWEAERVAAALRAEGRMVVIRPDDGPRLDAWMRHTEPIEFGDRLTVCFAWSEHDRGEPSNLVELGLGGFGNGAHPTTRLLVEELLEHVRGGERVLDVGCGSGVLSLCALRIGAGRVVAVDIKPDAVEATRRNAALNGFDDRLEARLTPLTDIEGAFDIVVANIGRAAIVELAPDLIRLVASGGWLAVSGISPPQCDLVGEFLRPLVEIDRRTSGEWAAVVLAPDRSVVGPWPANASRALPAAIESA